MTSILRHAVAFGGEAPVGWLPPGAARPSLTPTHVVLLDIHVRAESGGFLLEWAPSEGQSLPEAGHFAGDLWYEHLEDAMNTAASEFGVQWPETS